MFEAAEPGTEYVITRYRDRAMNLRTHFMRIIRRAGLTPWPKLWHNLRASRQTELAEEYPMHVVCQWIGNTGAVAMEHYLQSLDAHFAKATAERATIEAGCAAQIPAQSEAVQAGNALKSGQVPSKNRPDLPSDSAADRCLPNDKWPLSESNRYALTGTGF